MKYRSIRPYTEVKDSGIDWLGRIPAPWDVKRVKRLFRVVNGSTPKSGEPAYWDGDIVWVTPDDLGRLTSDTVTDSDRRISGKGYRSCGTTLVPPGSLVLSTRAPIGHLAIAGVELCTNQGCRGLVFRGSSGARYFYYQFLAARPELRSWGQGSTYGELGKGELEVINVAVPPRADQRDIAAFLDRETAKIDAMVAKKEELIRLLEEKRAALISHAVTKGLDPNAPMKDSGIDWLGQIPAHWVVAPLYARYIVQLGKMLDAKRITGDHLLPYLRNIDVQWDFVNVESVAEMDFDPDEYSRYTLKDGDLLVCEGGEVGRTAIWRSELPVCGFQKAIHRVRPKNDQDLPRYFYYVMRAATRSGIFVANGNANTIPHLTGEQLRVYRFPFPPRDEQEKIVAHLNRVTDHIDGLVSNNREIIEKLQEYRTALISAAVTGKIDVREHV